MTHAFAIVRRTPAPIPHDGLLKAGAASRDITPALGTHLSGFGSISSQACSKLWGRLFATALVIDDGEGERVALVAVDLHAGTRYLAELVAARVAPLTGIGIDRLFFAGTHTHSGPGHFYGNTLYDGMTAKERGIDKPAAERIAHEIAAAIVAAVAELRAARVGHGVARRWGYSSNRSLRAFKNDGASPARFAAALAEGAGVPEATREEELAVDPRVQVIWAEDLEGIPIGAFATFAAHGTSIAAKHATLSSDWFGVAVRAAEARIRQSDVYWRGGAVDLTARRRVPIALAAGAIGDADVSLPGLDCHEVIRKQGIALAREVGEAVGETLELACRRARDTLQDSLSIRVRFAEPRAAGAALEDGRALAPYHAFGVPVVGGSELGRNHLIDTDLLQIAINLESSRGHLDGQDPHSPKVTVSHEIVEALTGRPADVLPFRLVMLDGPRGRVWLPGVPGEPTTMLAFRIQQALGDMGATAVMVTGVCGDYAGYFTTPKEYERQHYEGASTLWGRASGDYVVEQLRRLAKGITMPLAPDARFEMDASYSPPEPEPASSAPTGRFGERPSLSLEGEDLIGRFRAPLSVVPAFGPEAWIRFEEEHMGAWRPLEHAGLPVDDQTHPMLIERSAQYDGALWTIRFSPSFSLSGRTLRYVLLPAAFSLTGEGLASRPLRVDFD